MRHGIPPPASAPQHTQTAAVISPLGRSWVMRDTSRNTLRRLGFHHDSRYEGGVVTLQVPLYPSLYALIAVDTESSGVEINVYQDSGRFYPPYYQRTVPYGRMMKQIDSVILDEFKRLGIQEKQGGTKN